MNNYTPATLSHFFSYETKVSLELPIGWELLEEGNHIAIYRCNLKMIELYGQSDSTEEYPPQFIVTAFEVPEADPDVYRNLAQKMIDQPRTDQKMISQATLVIDDYEAIVHVLSYRLEDLQKRLAEYQVFLQLTSSNLVYTLIGVVSEEYLTEFLPIFTATVQSIRFIPIEVD